ncbi:MAG: hypothetical protein DHS20C15_30610 [Planctomycetota bacterium]|nr:MAG: hypothetical protein DHS20C15_30610 [Planctomycetota bacterium]
MLRLDGLHARTALRLLGASLFLLLQPCVGSCSDSEWFAVDLRKSADIKRSNFSKQAENASVSVRNYRPRDLISGDLLAAVKGDRRMAIRGKGGDTPGQLRLTGAQGRGRFVLSTTLAVDQVDGLIAGTSFADFGVADSLEEGSGAAGAAAAERLLRVTWRDDTPAGFGLHVSALDTDADTPLLGELLLDGVRELELRLVQTDAGLDYLVRPLMSEEGDAEFQLVGQRVGLPLGDFEMLLGASGLGPSGELYFDQFWFVGPELGPSAASIEGLRLAEYTTVAACLVDALALLEAEAPTSEDAVEALQLVGSARTQSLATRLLLKQHQQDDAFAAGTPVKSALKVGGVLFNKLNRLENRFAKKLMKGKDGKQALKGIRKRIARERDRARAAQATMLGVQATRFGQIDRGLSINSAEIPAGVL